MKNVLLKIGIAVVAVAIVLVGIFLIKGKTYKKQNPIATIEIEGYDSPIKIELDPQSAPNAVANFIKLANNGYYTNFKMSIESNRIMGDESMQLAKLSNITENPQTDYVYGIKGDFIRNGFENLLKHQKGVITMERNDYSYFGYAEEGYNSANCNFAILTEDIPNYNGYYAAFGKVKEGMDILEKIAESRVEEEKTSEDNTTENTEESNNESEEKNKITIKSITVDTFGVDYGTPEVVNYEENMEKVNQIYSQYFGGSAENTITNE